MTRSEWPFAIYAPSPVKPTAVLVIMPDGARTSVFQHSQSQAVGRSMDEGTMTIFPCAQPRQHRSQQRKFPGAEEMQYTEQIKSKTNWAMSNCSEGR